MCRVLISWTGPCTSCWSAWLVLHLHHLFGMIAKFFHLFLEFFKLCFETFHETLIGCEFVDEGDEKRDEKRHQKDYGKDR